MLQRIVLINDKYGGFGGTEEYINSLARLLDPLGYETSIIYGKKYPKNFSNPLIREFRLPFLKERYAKAKPYELAKLCGYINKIRPDIVYIHNIFDYRIITAIRKAHLGKIIWYCHDHFFYCLTELKVFNDRQYELPLGKHCITNIQAGRCIERYPLRDLNLNEIFLERKKLLESSSLFDEIVVISKYMESNLIKNEVPKEKINLVPRQVYIPEKIERREEGKNILYVGRVVKEKGVDHLIKALEFIYCNVKLTIVGSGDAGYIEKCRFLAKDLKGKKKGLEIIFTGQKSHREVFEFYKKASVVAIPSLWPEPFGVVAAESLAHEVPVVAYNVGGIDTIIKDGETGLLAEPRNIKELGEKIGYLCSNKEESRKMGKNGRKFVKLKFDPQKHVDAILRLFS